MAAVVNIYMAQRVAGFLKGQLLWESCCVPALIPNCSTWVGMGKEEEKVLKRTQVLKLLWTTGPGSPRVALRADLGTRSMESWVWVQKILLIYHMVRLQEGNLARMMLEEQQQHGWPGLALDVAKLCAKLGLEDAATTRKDRIEYKKEVVKACKWMDEINIDMERMRYGGKNPVYGRLQLSRPVQIEVPIPIK